ncbi:Hypothetical_protein [Hexamita inflata]|uniref:Hypothetical_protein n=1 Tax=Hexamita inflata TaxID=28002 RepID=A0AA86TZL1_9EUKA|nr:Hypothetical protein HINF_LOCUS23670 [Hexamita inflata]
MIALLNTLSTHNQLDKCYSCMFQRTQSIKGLQIQIQKLCTQSSEATVTVYYQKQQLLQQGFYGNTNLVVQQTSDITVMIEQDGMKYVFYKRPTNSYDQGQRAIKIICSVLITMTLLSCIVTAMLVKKCKTRTNQKVVIVTPKNSENHSTLIL